MSSSTTVLMEPPQVLADSTPQAQDSSIRHQGDNIALESLGGPEPTVGQGSGELSNVSRIQQRWNSPRGNTWKTAAAFLALFNCGANDASYGVSYTVLYILPELE